MIQTVLNVTTAKDRCMYKVDLRFVHLQNATSAESLRGDNVHPSAMGYISAFGVETWDRGA